MLFIPLFVAVLSAVTVVCGVNWTATPFVPPSYPLAVRTPYLSAWLPQGAGAALNSVWPSFWNGKSYTSVVLSAPDASP
jgi:hypothetical protein